MFITRIKQWIYHYHLLMIVILLHSTSLHLLSRECDISCDVMVFAAEIAKLVKKAKARAPLLSPHVVYARQGTPLARYFDNHLIEDADSASGFSFAQFHESVAAAVVLAGAGSPSWA